MKLASAAQMRELDRQAIEERKIPSIDLMDRAAEGVARAALSLLPQNTAPGKVPGGSILRQRQQRGRWNCSSKNPVSKWCKGKNIPGWGL